MKKYAVIHRNDLSIAVTIKKEDFTSKLVDHNGYKILPEGTLLKTDGSKDIRKQNVKVLPADKGTPAAAVLVNTVEFKDPAKTQETVAAMLEGVVYLDKMPQGTEKADLPEHVTYINRDLVD